MFVIVNMGRIVHVKFISVFTIHSHTEFLIPKLNNNFHFFHFNARGSIYISNRREMSKGEVIR